MHFSRLFIRYVTTSLRDGATMAVEVSMRNVERLRYEMLLRVRDFGIKHRQRFPDGSMGGKAFDAVAVSAARIDAHNIARVLHGRRAKPARTEARAVLLDQLTAIVRTMRVASRTMRGSDVFCRVPSRLSDGAVLATARVILLSSQGSADAVTRLGLPTTFLADLQEAIDLFEQVVGTCRRNRDRVATAVQGIRTTFAQACDACRTLDVVVMNTLKNEPELLAAWARDRRVTHSRHAAAVALPGKVVSFQDAGRRAS